MAQPGGVELAVLGAVGDPAVRGDLHGHFSAAELAEAGRLVTCAGATTVGVEGGGLAGEDSVGKRSRARPSH